jgi:hypothetical protein
MPYGWPCRASLLCGLVSMWHFCYSATDFRDRLLGVFTCKTMFSSPIRGMPVDDIVLRSQQHSLSMLGQHTTRGSLQPLQVHCQHHVAIVGCSALHRSTSLPSSVSVKGGGLCRGVEGGTELHTDKALLTLPALGEWVDNDACSGAQCCSAGAPGHNLTALYPLQR